MRLVRKAFVTVGAVAALAVAATIAGQAAGHATVESSAAGLPWMNTSQTPLQRADELVAAMTLDQKITELHGIADAEHQRYVPGIPSLDIPPFVITNGPAGVAAGDVNQSATALPAPISLAASFDTSLARQYGVITGSEAADLGNSLVEGPDVNIARVPENGREYEGYGEDPYLSGQIGDADIEGIQSQGVIAEVKHFDANNQETNRNTINEVISDRTLHEIYLPQFETAVKDAHAGAVMCAYPSVNGEFMCQNDYLLDTVLRGQWGFTGFVQSDFGAAQSTVGSAEAGMDLEMQTGVYYGSAMEQAVEDGQVSIGTVNQLLISRFTVMFQFGLFDRALTTTPIPETADGAFARSAAEQDAVLLKNSAPTAGAAPQLPLDASAAGSVAVIGPYAGAAYTGGGGSSHVNPLYTVSPVTGIQNLVGPGVTVSYDDGSNPATAAALAKSSDVAIVMVGDVEMEGTDRTTLALPGDQDQLVEAVAAANPHTIVVVKSGGPVLMPWLSQVPAVLEAWYPGEEDGNAVAALLFGNVNPSGKLPVTFPVSDSQVPASTPQQWPGVDGTAVYSEGLDVGYRWYDANSQTPLFPFGYGLSYTTFSFRHLTVSRRLTPTGQVKVAVDVTNTGGRTGAEVAQVYVGDPASAGEPPDQLKGFAKVTLSPGQTKRLTFNLNQRAFSIWDSAAQEWTTVDGQYQVLVGDSSRNLPLHAPVTVSKTAGTQSVQVAAPPTIAAGASATVTTTFTNTGDFAVRNARLSLAAPSGWTVTAESATRLRSVAPHSSAQATWQVSAPSAAAAASYSLTATAAFSGVSGVSAATVTGSANIDVPDSSLAAAYDNTGVTDDSAPSAGAFAASGDTYSAQALAAAGLTAGGAVSHDGITFGWPGVASGQPDNVEADGQVIGVHGTGSTLAFLGASTNGTQGGTGTVYYTDGSSQSFTLSFSDWWGPAGTDEVVATAAYINTPTGKLDHTGSVYYAAIPLQSGKTVAAVELPATGVSPARGLHVFAITVGTASG